MTKLLLASKKNNPPKNNWQFAKKNVWMTYPPKMDKPKLSKTCNNNGICATNKENTVVKLMMSTMKCKAMQKFLIKLLLVILHALLIPINNPLGMMKLMIITINVS